METIQERLKDGECIKEYSALQPRWLSGSICALAGAAIAADSLLHPSGAGIALVVLGAALLYLGLRLTVLRKNAYVCVTDQRVLYRKVNWYGGPGRLREIPIAELEAAGLCRTTVMFGARKSGEGILRLKSGKERLLPLMQNAEYVIETIEGEITALRSEEKARTAPSGLLDTGCPTK